MDKRPRACMNNLQKALEDSHERIVSIIPYKNIRTAADGEEYENDVVEITRRNGSKLYVNVNCDSNLAAIYDVVSVLLDYKTPLDARCIEKLVPMKED